MAGRRKSFPGRGAFVAGAGLVCLAWVVDIGLVVVSAFHLAHWEPRSVIVGVIAVTPWIYMLAWPSFSIGLFTRRYALVALSAVLMGLQLWWVVPDFDPISHLATRIPGAVQVRIFDSNVSQSNPDLVGIAGEIRRYRPQIVTMEELRPLALAQLEATGVMDRFHYRLVRPTFGADGMALWSVYPLRQAEEWYAFNHPELRAWVEVPGGARFRIDVVHSTAPYLGPDEPFLWAHQMVAMRKELAQEPRPLVVVGDLNATWYDWHFQALLALGLRDAAVIAGQGWRMTWPRNQQPVVPYLRLDHVLVSKRVGLVSYGLGKGWGSEHHPLIVTLQVARI